MRTLPTLIAVMFTLAALSAPGFSAGLLDEFDTSHFVGYIDTGASADLTAIATARTGGQVKGNYVTWTGTVSDFSPHHFSQSFNNPITYAMTADGKFFAGVGGDFQQAMSVLMGNIDGYISLSPNPNEVFLTRYVMDYTHRDLGRDGLITGGTPEMDLHLGNATGIWNKSGETIFSALSLYEFMGSANNQNHSKFYGDDRKGPARSHWGPGFNFQSTTWREANLSYTNVEESIVHTSGFGDNSNGHETYTDGIRRTRTSSCCGCPDYWGIGETPANFRLKNWANWSHGRSIFQGVFVADNVTSSVTGGSGAYWNVPTAIEQYTPGWNGDMPTDLGGEVPEPMTCGAVSLAVAALGRYLRRRR